jgi:hypothetical protein
LGDKFDDEYWYWELVLLLRKNLIMSSYLLLSEPMEQAWLMGVAVMIIALILHTSAAPYEDPLIDWVSHTTPSVSSVQMTHGGACACHDVMCRSASLSA